ncbi:MAG TPA: spore coat U domain-containing protein [Rhizomicrobium sp.]
MQSARATNASSNFTVSATVLASCSVTAGNLSFGSYTASSATPNTASSTVAVTCTNGTTYSVSLDGGTVSNAMTARNMKDTAGDLLSYGLYTTSAYTTVWGDGTGGTGDNSSSGTGTAQSYTVYGQVPAAQYVAPSSYADQISVTVSY